MVIPIEGMISGMGSQWEGMVDIFMEQLQEAKDSKSVKAVVFRINAPGGTVGASQEMYDAVERFKRLNPKNRWLYRLWMLVLQARIGLR